MTRTRRTEARKLGRTWDFTPFTCASIAAQVAPTELIYNPPSDGATAPADLAPLRSALAARGLELEDLSAFYWRIVKAAPAAKPPPRASARPAHPRRSRR